MDELQQMMAELGCHLFRNRKPCSTCRGIVDRPEHGKCSVALKVKTQ